MIFGLLECHSVPWWSSAVGCRDAERHTTNLRRLCQWPKTHLSIMTPLVYCPQTSGAAAKPPICSPSDACTSGAAGSPPLYREDVRMEPKLAPTGLPPLKDSKDLSIHATACLYFTDDCDFVPRHAW